MSRTSDTDLLIIGGGAAGLYGAIAAAQSGLRVTVLEKNPRCGRKLLITGKGRCNVTNQCTQEEFLQNVRSNARFLYSALYRHGPADTMAFFERHGLSLKTERGRRVFPTSDRAVDVVDCLVNTARQAGVRFTEGTAKDLLIEDGQVYGVATVDGRLLHAGAVLIATGGLSYPATGSTGDGYRLAQQAGHTIIDPNPSLVPVCCEEKKLCQAMMGLSLRNVTLTVTQKGKELFSELGEMLFTHFGVSGPLVLSASAYMKKPAGCLLTIDCKPALTAEQLDARILRDFSENANRAFKNALGALLPTKMIPVIIERSGIDPEKKVHQITRAERMVLVECIKQFTLRANGLRPIDEAIVTAGGVKTGEVDPKTMQSKRCRNLYFAGEVLDVDAYTGGYNLQIAFSTAFAAAAAVREAKDAGADTTSWEE